MERNNFFINRALEVFLSHLNGIVPGRYYAFHTDDPRNQCSNLRYNLSIYLCSMSTQCQLKNPYHVAIYSIMQTWTLCLQRSCILNQFIDFRALHFCCGCKTVSGAPWLSGYLCPLMLFPVQTKPAKDTGCLAISRNRVYTQLVRILLSPDLLTLSYNGPTLLPLKLLASLYNSFAFCIVI